MSWIFNCKQFCVVNFADIRCILFDCMDTLVDMRLQPSNEDYARWAFEESGLEDCWSNFQVFLDDYIVARTEIPKSLPEHKEYEFSDRLLYVCRKNCRNLREMSAEEPSEILYRTYWRRYAANTHVNDDVRVTLPVLRNGLRLGMLSNFMNRGGIEELLDRHRISQHFDFVITSINVGWRKPHEKIYERGIQMAGCEPNEILFVGDNYECDYVGPKGMGMKAVLLDRENVHVGVNERVRTVAELATLIDGR